MRATLAETASIRQVKIAENAIAIFAETANPASMNDVDWIREGLEKPGKSRKGLAAALNTDAAVVTRILQGKRELKARELPIIRAYLNAAPSLAEEPRPFGETTVEDPYAGVPVFDVRISAGAGAIAEEVEPKHYLMFRRDWLRGLSRSPSQLCVLEVTGDSMWETLHDGDHALVDRSQANPAREGLYVLLLDDALVVKRISMHPVSKTLTIRSDNPNYPTYSEIKPDDVTIFGRVVWIGRRL